MNCKMPIEESLIISSSFMEQFEVAVSRKRPFYVIDISNRILIQMNEIFSYFQFHSQIRPNTFVLFLLLSRIVLTVFSQILKST